MAPLAKKVPDPCFRTTSLISMRGFAIRLKRLNLGPPNSGAPKFLE